jgi:hypothetical protein
MSCEKGTPPRREGLSEAGALGGGRTKPADEREPIGPLKSRISDERMAGAPIGRGRPILTVKRGWRSRPSRCARGLSAQRRLGGGEAGDRCSRPGCADQNKGPERLSVGNRLVGVLSTTSLGTVLLAHQLPQGAVH